jgi:hypothetical protein
VYVSTDDPEQVPTTLSASRTHDLYQGGRTGRSAVRRHRLGSVLATTAIVAVLLASLSAEFGRAVRTTSSLASPTIDRQYHTNLRQFSCLQAMVRRAVPKNAPVYIGGSDEQKLSEIVVLLAVPVQASQAQWGLSLSKGPCSGEGVLAVRLG